MSCYLYLLTLPYRAALGIDANEKHSPLLRDDVEQPVAIR